VSAPETPGEGAVKLAIVGSQHLTRPECETIIRDALERHKPSEVVSGAARGVDTWAVQIARECGIPVKEFPPAAQRWAAYKERDLQIATYCDRLLRIALKGSQTYGSGWTRDRAAEMGKPTEEVVVTRRPS
jgi:hypothetical protein